MGEQKNLFLAIILSLVVLIGYQKFFVEPQQEQYEAAQREAARLNPTPDANTPQPSAGNNAATPATATMQQSVIDPASIPRVAIDTPRLTGSISLKGAFVDDLTLIDYRQDVDQTSDKIQLLIPHYEDNAYYIDHSWTLDGAHKGPDKDTIWTASSEVLTPDSPVTLSWSNDTGLTFQRTISVDQNYMFKISQTIINNSDVDVKAAPFGRIIRQTLPESTAMAILHEGPLGVFGEALEEVSYSDLIEDGSETFTSQGGWMGITDKYWLTSLIPDQSAPIKSRMQYNRPNRVDRFQVDYIENSYTTVPAGQSNMVESHFFAGAKEVDVVEAYAEQLNIRLFDRTIDWGWLIFLTKPLFYLLSFLNGLVGNVGISILLMTVIVKAILFPLANKQYVSMTKMKQMAPKIKKLQERYKDDRMQLQQEMMKMYQKEKVNPMAGCLPILIQLPVFFALYKTLYVSLEMRHQPFFGWIQDLSAPDPIWITTLFGAFPWDVPGFLQIGIWPIVMGITMWMQQKLNPAPQDPIQAKVMAFLPILFTFILAPFAVGLVIYWTWNNILSMAQQWVIMRKLGVGINDDQS